MISVRLHRALGVFALVFAAALPSAAQKLNFPPERSFDVQHVRLDLQVDLEKKRVDSVATIQLRALNGATTVTFEGVDLDVRGAKVAIGDESPAPTRFSNSGKAITVDLPSQISRGQTLAIVIDYAVTDPKNGLHFFAPSPENPDAPYQVWSQGQSEENQYWIPCFDHPSEMQTSEILATVDEKYKVLSNGKLVETKPAGPGKVTYHWLQDQPHVTYLITLVVGDFAVKTDTWRGKPVLYYVPPDRVADIDRSFANTPRMLEFFSEKIGVEYPWPKYAQICCYNYGGGMENTSATTLGENTLHDERGHIDGDSDGLVAHELAHQWFGDLLTCRDWAHLWLNEGFASYFEALWDEQLNGPDEYAYNMLEKSGGAIGGGKSLPIVHRGYTDPGQQFDGRAYPKGAWVLHMLRYRLGEADFWKVIKAYVTQHRHQNVETADFRKVIESVTGRSFERFFYDWTERPGCPVLAVTTDWNDAEKLAEITVKQTQETDAFVFPLTIDFRLDGAEGGAAPIVITRTIDSKLATIVTPLPGRPVMVRIDPGNTVLKEITEEKSRDLWVRQLSDDPDPIGRIRAAQALAKNKTDANRRDLAKALASDKFWGVREQVATALAEMGGDLSRDALLAGLKDAKAQVRRECIEGLAKFTGDEAARAAAKKLVQEGDPSYRVESAAIAAYGKLAPGDARQDLMTSLERKSPRSLLSSAALRALAGQDDPAVIDLIAAWCEKDKPNEARQAAYEALASATMKLNIDGPPLVRVVETLQGGLGKENRRVRAAAMSALGALGQRASAALPQLREIAASDAGERSTRVAKDAIEKITKDTPAQQQMTDLNKKVQELTKENESLRDRIAKIEAKPHAENGGSH